MANPILGAPVTIVNADAIKVSMVSSSDLDTNGNPVPTYKAHAYTSDDNGNLISDTVTDGSSTWVRTYGYANSVGNRPSSDSGWVKQ